MPEENDTQQTVLFDTSFLPDHVGHIMTDPRMAIVELVANSYDAGATEIAILWPSDRGQEFSISDNGTGMTKDQFTRRWRTLSYSRLKELGHWVVWPPDVQGPKRRAFGKSGKGRHGAFCFADKYVVETWVDGIATTAEVTLGTVENEPFEWKIISEGQREGHGTRISGVMQRNHIPEEELVAAVGTKFLVVPSLAIVINEEQVTLQDLPGNVTTEIIRTANGAEVSVHTLRGTSTDRTTALRGVTWWVNGRQVGDSGWGAFSAHPSILDGRTTLAKTCSFIVEADAIQAEVLSDWTDFRASAAVNAVQDTVFAHVSSVLQRLDESNRVAKKRGAVEHSSRQLRELPPISRRVVGSFIDRLLLECPSLQQNHLEHAVQVLVSLEQSRSKYVLIERLAGLSPDDLDAWSHVMSDWTATDAQTVLDELGERLRLLDNMEKLLQTANVDELHQLQPLFERGLWIFGPEFESLEFTSNRAMTTVLRKMFGVQVPTDSRRPDFVALHDGSMGAYTCDAFDLENEVAGFAKVLIVELKTTGLIVGTKETRQAEDYAQKIRETALTAPEPPIHVYVLGSKIDLSVKEPLVRGPIQVTAMPYSIVLKRAHSRLFNLQRKLEQFARSVGSDPVIDEVLAGTMDV